MDRRTTIKWVLAAGSAWPFLHQRTARADMATAARGYGTDPDLLAVYRPGELWPLTLTVEQRRLAGLLADIIIPADDHSPSASSVGVVEFIDEWISGPYPAHRGDRATVLAGLAWLDAEAARRFGKEFADLDSGEQHLICEDICDEARAEISRRAAAQFFALYRDLTAGGFYSTPAGRKDLSYMGNVPLTRFEGPPADLLESLGLP
jgi:hypothetical protein